jgi:hypothetical protein
MEANRTMTKVELDILAQKSLGWLVSKCEVTRGVDILSALRLAGVETIPARRGWTAKKEDILRLSVKVSPASPTKECEINVVDEDDTITVINGAGEVKQIESFPSKQNLPKIQVSKILAEEIPEDLLFLSNKLCAKWDARLPSKHIAASVGFSLIVQECEKMIDDRRISRVKKIATRVYDHVSELRRRNIELEVLLKSGEDEYEDNDDVADAKNNQALNELVLKLSKSREIFNQCLISLNFV